MAYCSKCGAYIPDSMTRCLACGFDEHAADTAAQYAYKYDEQQAKKDYEAERVRKQEENKQWAREEYARRKKQQAEDEALAAERAREEEEERARNSYDAGRTSEAGLSYTQGNSRFFAAISYVPFLYLLQRMFLPDDAFAQFHGKQGRKLTFVWIAASIIGGIIPIPGLGFLAAMLGFGFMARGISNAKAGRMVDLPFISKLFNMFKK